MLSAEDASRRFMPAMTVRPLLSHSLLASSRSSASSDDLQLYCRDSMQHIWIVTGPAGCGKTTVAQGLASHLNIPYIEGDDYHSKKNKAKMARGDPLTDEDRWDWLIQLRQAAVDTLCPPPINSTNSSDDEDSDHAHSGVVVTCSALKGKYRDVMRVAAYNHRVKIHFVYLRADEQTLTQRVNQRKNHYMKAGMVKSQLAMLEEPVAEWDALSIDCAASQGEVQRRVHAAVMKVLEEY